MANPTLQRLFGKWVMRLPPPVLRALSGGETLQISGRRLDPQFQMLAYAAKGRARLSDYPAPIARAAAAQGFRAGAAPIEAGVAAKDFQIPAPKGPLTVRSYQPDNQHPASPVFVYLHMGGGVIGDLDTGHAFCSILAKGARCAVVSVDYRLAPEHPFPQGLDDSLFAFRWARDNADQFGAPAGLAAVGGDSMGGNFAAVIVQDLKRSGEPQPVLQLLVYPATDVSSETQSMTAFADAFPLSRSTMDWFMSHYIPKGASAEDQRISPLRAEDLSGLAPAIVVTAGFDPLCDQGEIYAYRLMEAGVPTLYRCYDSLAHAFVAFTARVKAAEVACWEIAGMVRQGFEGKISECSGSPPRAP